jgi:hypothetical protein
MKDSLFGRLAALTVLLLTLAGIHRVLAGDLSGPFTPPPPSAPPATR